MSPDEYLQRILARESVDTGPYSPVRGVQALVMPTLQQWGGQFIRHVQPSGSFAKGTANKSGTDIDLFISLSESVTNTMKEIYNTLFNKVNESGYQPKRRNVSISITVNGYAVDLVPAKRQNGYGEDHSLYRRRADSWTKTNVTTHINQVIGSGCDREIRIVKLWRDQKGLDFPSFYLELLVIRALSGAGGTLSQRVRRVFEYFRDTLPNACIIDPANTNNIVSDDLTAAERTRISTAAAAALKAKNWSEIVR
jgi:hypothetical protein